MKFFQREKQLAEQAKELRLLRAEVAELRTQNESVRQGMRRCISCDYRLEARARSRE